MGTTISSDDIETQEKKKIYLVRYNYKGTPRILEVWASSFEDARERLKVVPFGTVMGELDSDVEIPKPFHPVVHGLLKIRRFLFGTSDT